MTVWFAPWQLRAAEGTVITLPAPHQIPRGSGAPLAATRSTMTRSRPWWIRSVV